MFCCSGQHVNLCLLDPSWMCFYVKASLRLYPSVCSAAQASMLIYAFWILSSFVSYRVCFRSLYSFLFTSIVLIGILEYFLIGILDATSGVLIGIAGGYLLSEMVPHSATGPGGGGGVSAPAHADPIFVPSDLLRVWSISLLLSIAAGI